MKAGCEFGDRTCHYCGVEIMYVGILRLKRRVTDVNGFCPNSPDDLHHPAAETETRRPGEVGSRDVARATLVELIKG